MTNILPTDLIANGTVPQATLIMILMLPVIATILGFARHVIGLKSLGLYAPLILTYAYFQLGLTSGKATWGGQVWYGLKLGILLTIIVFVTTYITHIATKKIRIHYFPKIALVLTSVAISTYILIIFADLTDKQTFLNTGFLPIILIASVSEQFVSMLNKKDLDTTLSLSITTMIITAAAFSLIIYKPFQDLIIERPYLLLLTILANILIGRFTGLRALEYLRFQDILDEEEN